MTEREPDTVDDDHTEDGPVAAEPAVAGVSERDDGSADAVMLEHALGRLRRVAQLEDFDPRAVQATRDPLVRAMDAIGQRIGFTVSATTGSRGRGLDRVQGLARASGVRLRRVTLEGPWAAGMVHPLLGFRAAEAGDEPGSPLVVYPPAPGRSAHCWDPVSQEVAPVDSVELSRHAYEFTAPLRARGALTYRQIAAFTFAGVRPEAATTLVLALLVGLLGLLTPIATNHAFSTLVPEGERTLLIAAGAGLAVAALVVWAFTVVQGFAVTRASLRAEQRLQPAVWSRVLALPASFFRRFQSGELTVRILGVDQLRQIVSTSSVSVVLTAVFSTVNLVVMFVVDPLLGVVGTALLVVVTVVTLLIARRLIRTTSGIVRQSWANNASITDILEGLSAIRTAAAEPRFFALHAELVRRKVVLQARQQRVAIVLQAFYAGLVTGVPAVIIATIWLWGWDATTGSFTVSSATYLTFVTALNTVLTALMALSALIQPLSTAPQTLRAMDPIFSTEPEYDVVRRDPGVLRGKVELRNVSFQYGPNSPMVLQDCSLRADPGQFVALVGPSGAGKSTVLRLMLGFETPAAGSVVFDDHDLADVDLASVRSQLGVVLQQARPTGGTIFTNVVGARRLGTDEAWVALEAAGLADDVRAMPMGLQTHVAPDGSTLSGGQLQRLMIARALVTKPAVLLLDEATSALDEVTQAEVSDGIAALGITRIAVAHRLSTIRAADRIMVISNGGVAEQGDYDELMGMDGLFARLARRQLI